MWGFETILQRSQAIINVYSPFPFCPRALRNNSLKVGLHLLLFLLTRQGLRGQKSWVLGGENIKSKTESLEQKAWQMFALSTRTINCLVLHIKEPGPKAENHLSWVWGRKKELKIRLPKTLQHWGFSWDSRVTTVVHSFLYVNIQ